jgi:hypothetical protein
VVVSVSRRLRILADRRGQYRRAGWRDAQTFDDLAELTARWLDGSIPVHAGYPGGPPDAETLPIAGLLAVVNRAGYLTICSQPGFDGMGCGRAVQQRAAVEGFVRDREALGGLLAMVAEQKFVAVVSAPGWRTWYRNVIPVTRFDSGVGWKTYTSFGAALSRRAVADLIFRGCPMPAVREVCAGWQITIVDPEWGRDDRLWPALRLVADDLGKTVAL